MKAIGPDGFEAMFRANVDPWNYATSRFEAFKRGVLLRACGGSMSGRALELACANGETTMALAPRALRLLAADASPTALAEARRRTTHLARVACRVAVLPDEMPRGPFDLIVVSELLYYMTPNACRLLLARLEAAMAPGGRIVLLHHLKSFGDASQLPALAQEQARKHFQRRLRLSFRERHGRFEAVAFSASAGVDRSRRR